MGSYAKGKVGEEGGISGPASDPDPIVKVERDENKQNQTSKVSSESSNNGSNNNKRYWMKDLYNYPYSRMYGSASGLYNLAWAQAVQNKPLNEVLVEFNDKQSDDKNSNNSSSSSINNNGNNNNGEESGGGGEEAAAAVSEVLAEVDGGEESEKEEGELEEGEIDLDRNDKYGRNGNAFETEDGDLEIQVSSIRKVLDNVTVAEAIKSFDIVCARLKSSLESLKQLVLHTWFPSKDALIQRSFDALLSLHSVFSNMSPSVKDQNKDKMSRLLTFVTSQSSSLFTAEQRKEVEAMNAVINPPALPKPKPKDKQEQLFVADKPILTDSNTLSVNAGGDTTSDYLKNFVSESSVNTSDKKNLNILPELVIKPPLSNVKSRGNYALLLDLHKVHDEDSLPSPTSKSTPSLPPFDSSAVSRTVHSVHTSGVHPYETDALKAVSFYQQRFGRSSFLTPDRLPSPTPSEEGNDGGNDDDAIEEVSSFAAYPNIRNTNPSALLQPAVSCVSPQPDVSSMLPQPAVSPMLSQSAVSSVLPQPAVPSALPQPTVSSVLPQPTVSSTSIVQGLVTGSSSGLSSTRSNSASRASAKSRDPRLRHINSSSSSSDLSSGPSPMVTSSTSSLDPLGEVMNQKKTKAPEGSVLDVPALKRQRSGLDMKEIFKKVNETQTVSGSSGLQNSNVTQLASRVPLRPALADPRKLGSGVITSGVSTSSNPNVAISTASQSTTIIGNTATSLQSLLKDIAGNPTAWMDVFKEQQKSAELSQSMSHLANSSSTIGTISLPNTAPAISSGLGQNSAGSLQNPQDESGKLRMKPRDPRRVLHNNIVQKMSGSGSEQPKVNATTQGGQDSMNIQRPGNGANNSLLTCQATDSPDIAVPLTKSLMNLAEIMSAPHTSNVQQPLLPTSSPQSVQVNLDRDSVTSGSDQHNGSAMKPETVVPGHPQSQNAWGDVEHLFEGYDDKQKAAIHQERARRLDEQNKMFAEHKLCLVLDLDHTLLNSAKFTEVDPIHDEILRKKEEQDREKPRRHLFRFPHMGMWTKLRPGIWNFLEKASKLYELHLYTMGNKLYATEMAKVLDPKGTLFSGRVISRGDDGELLDGDERVPKSKDLEGVLGMESAVVIIDDSVRVWPHNKLNLIVVERYTYFPCSRRQFGLPGPSLLEIDHDERPEEGTLASSLAVIEKIHENFFSHKSLDSLDVRSILAAEQRKILGGCRIVFSRVFPVGEANPHMHPLWQTAEQFGAVCTNQIDEQVTHVVANSLGTDKVNWALSTGRYVVHPGWVEASALLYRRANEQDFAIKP